MEEVRHAIFDMSGDSAGDPDGFSGLLFQACWDMMGEDVTNVVKSFFCGWEILKYITHSKLVLILKKEVSRHLTDLKPISLSNVINEVISKVLTSRVYEILPNIISPNQSCFIRDRSISENVLLA